MSTDLQTLVHEADSIMDLESRLQAEGHTFKTIKDYLQWLDTQWEAITWPKIELLLNSPPEQPVFPTLIVKVYDVEYYLHGVAHGQDSAMAPGWQCSPGIRDYISRTMASFHKPQEGEDYLFEGGLHKVFNLLETQEIKDEHLALLRLFSHLSFWKVLGMSIAYLPLSLASKVVLPLMYIFIRQQSKKIEQSGNFFEVLMQLSQQALADERHLSTFAECYIAHELPQPLNMEKEYLEEKCNLISKMLQGPLNVTSGERSLISAQELKSYAYTNKLQKLHYLGGLAHITEIGYLLNHKYYSFSLLKGYLGRRNAQKRV